MKKQIFLNEKPYSKGLYNKSNENEQWIRITEGCPNNCEYCRETKENGIKPIYYKIPLIIRNHVKIMDMNLIYKPKCNEILNFLGNQKVNKKIVYYELICGIDYRYLTQEKANLLYKNHFINIRFAWDYEFKLQYKIKDCVKMLINAGYKPKNLSCFILCDHKITYDENLRKMDLLKVWNILINDCWFNNTVSPNFQCNFWTLEQCKNFRQKSRKHNQIIKFGIDPEYKI
jgi:hypothetical protein